MELVTMRQFITPQKKVGGYIDSYCNRREQIEKAYNVLK